MKKMNKKYVLSTIIMFALAISCGYIILFVDNSLRYLIACVIATFAGIINLMFIKSKDSLVDAVDERDQVNIDKSSHKTIQLLNYFLAIVIFSSLTLYGVTKIDAYLVVGLVELCTVIVALLLSLFTQSYYEKRN